MPTNNLGTGSSWGNVPWIKEGYKKLLGLGEGVVGDEFIMTFEDNSNIRYLVQSTQLPAIQRENIESYGPQGVQFNQQGRYKNAQDVTITIKETIKGYALEYLRDWVVNKQYKKVRLQLAGESYTDGTDSGSIVLEDCWLEIDATDVAVDSATELVRPSGTMHCNWAGWDDGV